MPPADRKGVAADEYALACLTLGMFAPMATIMLQLHRPKAVQLGQLVEDVFPVPRALTRGAVQTILGDEAPAAPYRSSLAGEWPDIRAAITTSILASATPERTDRLFPGDIVQFEPGGGISLANGAAGVLYALAATGAGRVPEHEEWLRARVLDPDVNAGIGFYNGLHGVAYVLAELGRRDDALAVADLCARREWESLDLSLYGGLSGVALALYRLYDQTGEPAFRDLADQMAERTADRLGGPDSVPETSGGKFPHAGLMFGSSGPALMFLHAYERTGDPAMLDLASTALRQDLRRCVHREDGQLQVQQGWRTNPYLDEGSVGIGLVLARYLAHRADETFSDALDAIRPVSTLPYFIQSGLFAGRAGMIACHAMGLAPADPSATDAQIARLAWHELPFKDGLIFPGAQLLRMSTDFSTGSAGVLFALGTALHDEPVRLPFFEPPRGTPAQGPLPPSSGRHITARP